MVLPNPSDTVQIGNGRPDLDKSDVRGNHSTPSVPARELRHQNISNAFPCVSVSKRRHSFLLRFPAKQVRQFQAQPFPIVAYLPFSILKLPSV
jgi:hypothetical protein